MFWIKTRQKIAPFNPSKAVSTPFATPQCSGETEAHPCHRAVGNLAGFLPMGWDCCQVPSVSLPPSPPPPPQSPLSRRMAGCKAVCKRFALIRQGICFAFAFFFFIFSPPRAPPRLFFSLFFFPASAKPFLIASGEQRAPSAALAGGQAQSTEPTGRRSPARSPPPQRPGSLTRETPTLLALRKGKLRHGRPDKLLQVFV